MGEGLGNLRSMSVEQALRLVLVLNPGGNLRRSSPLGFTRRGTATARIAMFRLPLLVALDAAIAIDVIIAQATEHAGAVTFRRQLFPACRGLACPATTST